MLRIPTPGIAEVWGDSISAGNPPWYRDLQGMGAYGINIGRTPGRGGYYRRSNPPPVTWVQNGVPGDRAQEIDERADARLAAHHIDALIMQFAVNDILMATSDVVFASHTNSAVDKALLAQPWLAGRIALNSIFCYQENIPVGNEANIDAKDAIMAATMARVGGTFINVRPKVVEWEAANNPPGGGQVSSGKLTVDGIHLSALGVQMWGVWSYPYVSYTDR